MALDATCQIRMNSELKAQVEELYRNLGTSFAEAVRIFAQQSLREGGLPFRPALKTWDELTEAEIDSLPWGARLMTLECGMRFLTDHLQNDVYFKIHRENHNLDRARTQFKLVADMEDNWSDLLRAVQ